MRVAVVSSLTVIVALLLAYVAWIHLDADDPDPEPPKRIVAEKPVPPPDSTTPFANAWRPERAVTLKYDKNTDEFILQNVSPHFVWYGAQGDPWVWSQRQLPSGKWVHVFKTDCNMEATTTFLPLAPGKRLAFR